MLLARVKVVLAVITLKEYFTFCIYTAQVSHYHVLFNVLTQHPLFSRDVTYIQTLYSQPGQYIYIYILSSTDRMFHCITSPRRGCILEMLQAEIETWLILWYNFISLSICKCVFMYVFVLVFVYLTFVK